MTASSATFEHIKTLRSDLSFFLPAIFACGYFVNSPFAAVMGLVFIAGRGLYFRGYTDPDKSRTAGFAIGELANILMVLSTLFVTVTSLP